MRALTRIPLHLHRHTFEITNFAGKLTGGVHKDVVLVNPYSTAEIDFVADFSSAAIVAVQQCTARERIRYPAIVTVTSLPLSATATREAAALLAEISRKPVLPRSANSSPAAPSA